MSEQQREIEKLQADRNRIVSELIDPVHPNQGQYLSTDAAIQLIADLKRAVDSPWVEGPPTGEGVYVCLEDGYLPRRAWLITLYTECGVLMVNATLNNRIATSNYRAPLENFRADHDVFHHYRISPTEPTNGIR